MKRRGRGEIRGSYLLYLRMVDAAKSEQGREGVKIKEWKRKC